MSSLPAFTDIEEMQKYLRRVTPKKSRTDLSFEELFLIRKCSMDYPIVYYIKSSVTNPMLSGYDRKDRQPTPFEMRRRLSGMRKREGYKAAREMDAWSRTGQHSFYEVSKKADEIRQSCGVNLLFKNWKYADIIRFAAAENDIEGKSTAEVKKLLFLMEV